MIWRNYEPFVFGRLRPRALRSGVHIPDSMSASQFNRRFGGAVILCLMLAFLIGRLTGFEPRWRGLKDGMTEAQVRQALGPPSSVGTSGCIGWGGRNVLRWEYRRFFPKGCMHYYVDFDYI